MVTAAAAASAQAPPVAHAIGGSLGSAIALLIFYPLERARIELQSQASQSARKLVFCLDEGDADGKIAKNEKDTKSPSPHTNFASCSQSDSSWQSLTNKENNEPNERAEEMEECETNCSSFSTDPAPNPASPNATGILIQKRKDSLFECLLQLHQRKELYTGVSPVVSTIFTSQFIFFYMHAMVKKLLKQSSNGRTKRSNPAALSLLSSCLAGLGNVMLTNPLWVTNMKIVTGETKTRNLWRELYVMIQKKGWYFMWSGTSASVLLVSNPVIQFFCYEQIKAARLASLKKSILPPIEVFFIGAMAKGIATVTT